MSSKSVWSKQPWVSRFLNWPGGDCVRVITDQQFRYRSRLALADTSYAPRNCAPERNRALGVREILGYRCLSGAANA